MTLPDQSQNQCQIDHREGISTQFRHNCVELAKNAYTSENQVPPAVFEPEFFHCFYFGQVWSSLVIVGQNLTKTNTINLYQPLLPKPYQRCPYPFSYPFTIRGVALISR